MIQAKIVADSTAPTGDRLTTMMITFPRIILAELNTHRMLSKNSASSRAIPFKKMVQAITDKPFIPIAWQKDHKGMQGTEYFDKNQTFYCSDFLNALTSIFDKDTVDGKHLIEVYRGVLFQKGNRNMTLDEWWIEARDSVLDAAVILSCLGVTKQLCNRLLEPFMWHTVLISGTEWENFFALRCPRYKVYDKTYRSKRDAINAEIEKDFPNELSDLDWLLMNKGQAEIHMMALAEAMWDAYNESKPVELHEGEWHIPFTDQIPNTYEKDGGVVAIGQDSLTRVKIATVMAARTSYTVVGADQKPLTVQRMLEIHDEMANADPKHMSPFEHCARVMTEEEYEHNTILTNLSGSVVPKENFGWCGNFRGFIQYRKMIPNENITLQ